MLLDLNGVFPRMSDNFVIVAVSLLLSTTVVVSHVQVCLCAKGVPPKKCRRWCSRDHNMKDRHNPRLHHLSVCLSAVHHGFTSPLSLLILCSSSTPKQFWANSTPAKFGSRSVGFEKQFCKSRLGNSTTALLTPPHWCWWWCCCCCCWGVMWVWWVCMLWDDGGDGDGCWRIISLSLRISSTFLCECECLAAT